MTFHTETLPGNTATILKKLSKNGLPKGTFLAGGTAIALQLGHRVSHDLDFFTPEAFEEERLAERLEEDGLRTQSLSWRTIIGYFGNVQFSCFYYKYPLLFETLQYEGIPITDLRDGAAMKLEAIAGRATKRDYIDLYAILRHFKMQLPELLELHMKKYLPNRDTVTEAIRSLTYFKDVEERDGHERPLEMLEDIKWEDVKSFLVNEVNDSRKYLQ